MRRSKINVLFFLTKEGNNGRLGLSSGNDPQLVAHKNLCVRAGTCDHAVVQTREQMKGRPMKSRIVRIA